MDSIKVVKIVNKKPYRTILKKGEYKKNKKGQIILPNKYFSKGYFERISNRKWYKLPILKIIKRKINKSKKKRLKKRLMKKPTKKIKYLKK
tara:strand:+ start:415 stop:687 length:273 start_codon:yes stop_codon:yes gene_type:complete